MRRLQVLFISLALLGSLAPLSSAMAAALGSFDVSDQVFGKGKPAREAPAANAPAASSTSAVPGEDVVLKASRLYEQGKYAEANALLTEAAEKGDERAAFGLGMMAVRGQGKNGKEDYKAAEKWWLQSARAGNPEAQFQLGLLYNSGFLGGANNSAAREWWEKSAAKGHGDAMYCLGRMYAQGEGVKKDQAKAAEWYGKAAQLGHPDAQYQLAMMYAQGEGVPQDKGKAKEWLGKAAQNKHPLARQALDHFEK